MTSRQKDFISVLVVMMLVAASVLLVHSSWPPRLGLDLRGGMNVVLTADPRAGKASEQDIEQAKFIVQERVDGLGVAEPQIERQIGTPNIIIQLPGIKDPKEALNLIRSTAMLEFRELVDDKTGKLGPPLMTGKAISRANVGFEQLGTPKVDLKFTAEGSRQFADVTERMVNKRLAIVLDGKVMSAPEVNEKITGGEAQITGKFTLEEAKRLVLVLNSGALPVGLKVTQQQTVGPTLGADSLRAGLVAGAVGLALVVVFMLVNYRGLGLITIISLLVFGSIFAGVLTLMKSTLTLPGIAGIILTVGLAADSSIVYFERFREEIRSGKQTRSAAMTGFTHAIRAMLDADATGLVIAGTLIGLSYLYFGAGPVRGFAVMLTIGVVIDLLTTYFFTRPALVLLSDVKLFKNPVFIGVREGAR